ncbi:MAG: hypothetical protein AAGD38_15560 [Acidobacteriota bacterium]
MRRPLLALLLVWALGACALELYRSWWLWHHHPWDASQPSAWRIHGEAPDDLHRFLTAARPHLPPPGSHLATLTEGPDDERFFRRLWTQYWLPEYRVGLMPEPAMSKHDGATELDAVLVYGTQPSPELEPMWRNAAGGVYRVRPGDASVSVSP